MNKINFMQTGGFPLETDTLDFLQTAVDIFNTIADVAGHLSILRGCVVTGSQVTDGVVSIGGEVLTFKGGTVGANVVIREDIEERIFEDGNSKPVFLKRYATFGTAVTSYPWSGFVRINPLRAVQRAVVPVDFIGMWGGSVANIPPGWYLCDGTNGTPNLSGRFIAGYDPNDPDYDAIGNPGGFKNMKLLQENLPKHRFTGTTSTDGSHSHNYTGPDNPGDHPGGSSGYTRPNGTMNRTTGLSGSHSHSFQTNEIGNDVPFDNRPPYYTLAYIQFKG